MQFLSQGFNFWLVTTYFVFICIMWKMRTLSLFYLHLVLVQIVGKACVCPLYHTDCKLKGGRSTFTGLSPKICSTSSATDWRSALKYTQTQCWVQLFLIHLLHYLSRMSHSRLNLLNHATEISQSNSLCSTQSRYLKSSTPVKLSVFGNVKN